jgi:hypothetical protein
MPQWVVVNRYVHHSEHVVHTARLAHEGIPFRLEQGAGFRRRTPETLLRVPRKDAMMACKILGLPEPLLEPESELTGLGLFLHERIAPMLNRISANRTLSLRAIVITVLIALAVALVLFA